MVKFYETTFEELLAKQNINPNNRYEEQKAKNKFKLIFKTSVKQAINDGVQLKPEVLASYNNLCQND